MEHPVLQKGWGSPEGHYRVKDTIISVIPYEGGWQTSSCLGTNDPRVAPWFNTTGFGDVVFPTLKDVRNALRDCNDDLPPNGETGNEICFIVDGVSRSVWYHGHGLYSLESSPSVKHGDEFACFKKIPTGYSLQTRRWYIKRELKERGQYPTLRSAVEAYYERPWELRKRLVSHWQQH